MFGKRKALKPGLVLVLVVAPAGIEACGQPPIGPQICARPRRADPLDVSTRVDGLPDGVYQSAAWNGPFLYFPGGEFYRFEHNLGCVPYQILPYLSFEQDATAAEASVGLAAGNQVEIKEVTEDSITVVNGSCATYWLMMVAVCDPASTGVGGAGGGAMDGVGGGPELETSGAE